ncbi:MAG: hypothetical protein ACLPSH_09145 [Vulcanimicrobiaceae bacterium]
MRPSARGRGYATKIRVVEKCGGKRIPDAVLRNAAVNRRYEIAGTP